MHNTNMFSKSSRIKELVDSKPEVVVHFMSIPLSLPLELTRLC